jgi:hypothetical protein
MGWKPMPLRAVRIFQRTASTKSACHGSIRINPGVSGPPTIQRCTSSAAAVLRGDPNDFGADASGVFQPDPAFVFTPRIDEII